MPELPEVETIVQDLNKKIKGKRISKVNVRLKRIVKSENFVKVLIGNSVKEALRRGKLIIFKLEKENNYLLVHLRMTGQVIYQQNNRITAGGHSDNNDNLKELPNKHSHVIIYFTDGSKLFFNDQRQFGVLKIVNAKRLQEEKKKFGIEPLSREFNTKYLENLIKNKKKNIKAFLLDQKYIAGIGNIYADETLFRAGVSPTRRVDSLTKNEIKKIAESVKIILKKAIQARGTTFNNYVDADGNQGSFVNFLKIYGRGGKECKKCKTILKKIKVAGRGTVCCPKCQK
ncbi:DNA-formamidopyrimidine glycosylase [Candidatus Falkowbacteria bacterium RIFOXYB2_FULL_34_18]|uniref:Formamidopyrimidine-DNA glycosylase n=1 Tax=Candidatus Falkowbacteria bacterium RIFOXYD2_FULL_34_120 TaxID=1798007 RepID=A0A1F5TNA0_9BACT|nr:MAG: DNA-formamidopyrimidine glycosylase [Candidatus Falkowbacteria bacterium RIFOXYC12_FULL_34_55]OGF28895.1 MAG: DNA-formamidopyrimidine glycosylase [Candidatus Falkowbacteria bacterium RIFOXYB2_FULL_34_18]OGF35661.1 MAG: DNA-formamidopyrimidine glycosylase [Candidatus Falkowbacteria bacterium RIFOXYC2_FULL_34_220]OGF38407.1 MAG: DNA-formamidopyrimidine glycosylase [Candidatus Falkowbacteria bacterium RIFOXYD12_FULL_34_57]OGF40455.1 MAG: DNA-formamidopyrimidine glycosylase [Candidatus Falk